MRTANLLRKDAIMQKAFTYVAETFSSFVCLIPHNSNCLVYKNYGLSWWFSYNVPEFQSNAILTVVVMLA